MDKTQAYWPAPAKLNLFLHVNGQREDGYHLLQTLFQFVDLHDRIWIKPREDSQIVRHGGLSDLPPEQDLVVKAALSLQEHSECRLGADIEVEKHIPAGGGLGGGSTDAATVLLVLNKIWGLDLSLDELASIGLRLGADVPVFVRGEAAWAEGVGEKLTPISTYTELEEPWFLILHPGSGVSTPEVFRDPKLTRNTPAITIRAFISGDRSISTRNDLEKIARQLNADVASALDWLACQPGAIDARMTGSGACVFANFANKHEAEAIAQTVQAPWKAFVTRGRNRSPLHDLLSN